MEQKTKIEEKTITVSELKSSVDKIVRKLENIAMGFWMVGFLFTLGIVGVDPNLSSYTVLEQILIMVISWLLWPLTLGLHFAK